MLVGFVNGEVGRSIYEREALGRENRPGGSEIDGAGEHRGRCLRLPGW